MRSVAVLVLLALQCISNSPVARSQTGQRVDLHVDAIGFFQNNEYFGLHGEGYTLPGFSLTPQAEWRVDDRTSLEVGLHLLHFWGAHNYPASESLNVWHSQDDSIFSTWHLLPWFRATMQLLPGSDRATLTLGNLYSAERHLLPLPLFNPERLYAADPEAGIQLRFNIQHLLSNVWVDWREYIWQHSSRQERFTFGLSARPYASKECSDEGKKLWSIYMPLAFIAQHVGGQGLINRQPVQNHFNASAGVGVLRRGIRWAEEAELHLMAYNRSSSPQAPFNNGWALYPTTRITYSARSKATLDIGYWYAKNFIPLLGSGLFSNLTNSESGVALEKVKMISAGINWQLSFSELSVLNLEGRIYYYLDEEKALQYSFGCNINLKPSIKLTR